MHRLISCIIYGFTVLTTISIIYTKCEVKEGGMVMVIMQLTLQEIKYPNAQKGIGKQHLPRHRKASVGIGSLSRCVFEDVGTT